MTGLSAEEGHRTGPSVWALLRCTPFQYDLFKSSSTDSVRFPGVHPSPSASVAVACSGLSHSGRYDHDDCSYHDCGRCRQLITHEGHPVTRRFVRE